jgi:hypothetical protein
MFKLRGQKKQVSPLTGGGPIYYFTPRNGQSPGIGTSNRAFSTGWMDPCYSVLGNGLPVRQLLNVLQPPPAYVWQVAPMSASYGAPIGGVPTGQLFTQALLVTQQGSV